MPEEEEPGEAMPRPVERPKRPPGRYNHAIVNNGAGHARYGQAVNILDFKAKWSQVTLKESAAYQEHFIDLCHALGYPTPAQADPEGTHYTFQRGARKTAGGKGFADVWYRNHFGWE